MKDQAAACPATPLPHPHTCRVEVLLWDQAGGSSKLEDRSVQPHLMGEGAGTGFWPRSEPPRVQAGPESGPTSLPAITKPPLLLLCSELLSLCVLSSLILTANPVRGQITLPLIQKQGERGSERLGDISKATQ